MVARKSQASKQTARLPITDAVARRVTAYFLIKKCQWSERDAAAQCGFSRTKDAANWAERVERTGSASAGGGRPGPKPRLGKEHTEIIGEALLADKIGLGIKRVVQKLRQQGVDLPEASASTIGRALRSHDWSVQPTGSDLRLGESQKRVRLQFCKRRRDDGLHLRGTFSDSKVFFAGSAFRAGKSSSSWARTGKPRPSDRRTASVKAHVYAAVTPHGATKLYFATGTTGVKHKYSRQRPSTAKELAGACEQLGLPATGKKQELAARLAGHEGSSAANAANVANVLGRRPEASGVGAEEYRDILAGAGPYSRQPGMLAEVQQRFHGTKYAKTWWWQQDGARAHSVSDTPVGRQTRALIDSVAPHFVSDWPANSPDLSLIENVWSHVEWALWAEEDWTDAASFREALVRVWEKKVMPAYCRKLFAGWEKRRDACVAGKGGRVNA